MKKQSEQYPEVFYERWKTPVSDIDYIDLWLAGVLQTMTEIHFFLQSKKSKKIHVMSILRLYPYRVMDEGLAYSCIDKYFRWKDPYISPNKQKGRPTKASSAWKLWGSDLIQELDEFHALSGYAKEKDKTICEYLIQTTDECIEIVDCEPKWEVHQNTTIEKLIALFVKTRFRDSKRWKK